jgi:hypothetical protein
MAPSRRPWTPSARGCGAATESLPDARAGSVFDWACRVASIAAILFATGQPAAAHVKWFCAYNVSAAPQPLASFLDRDFLLLVAVALVIFCMAGLVDRMFIGRAMIWSIDRVTGVIQGQVPILMRATYGGFFVALWTAGGIILTPELTTRVPWISTLQLVVALCFVWERTLVVAACGMAGLYSYAVLQYGVFHLLDYPIFLGAALYFALTGLRRRLWGAVPLDVMRIAAGVTLIWASVEKWGYPQWSYPLFLTHPAMAMGFTPPYYMMAAGVVEFSLAFALLGPPLMRRTAAIILASMFAAAILAFGKIDAIGHAPIIVVLLAVAADPRIGRRWPILLAPAGYTLALTLAIGAYYGLHAALF